MTDPSPRRVLTGVASLVAGAFGGIAGLLAVGVCYSIAIRSIHRTPAATSSRNAGR